MDIKHQYKVIITPTAYKEINRIYDYITEDLYAGHAANRLMKKIEQELQRLKEFPRIHTKIKKYDTLKRSYRRIVIKNYVLLYTIEEETNTVYVSHIYYSGRNYLDYNF